MQKNYRPGGVGMVAATPGTYLVHAYFDSNQVEVVRANVIGWQIGADRSVTPLLIDPRAADSDHWSIVHPDGRVESSTGGVWVDEASWIDEQRRTRREAA
jgi:hypothetical protein